MPGLGCTCGSCSTCYQRAWRAKKPDKVKAAKDRWGKSRDRTGDPQAAEVWKAYYQRTRADRLEYAKNADKHKISARNKLTHALRKGWIVRQPCEVCGKEKVDAHHDDYDKPLEVRWLCRTHHLRLHRS